MIELSSYQNIENSSYRTSEEENSTATTGSSTSLAGPISNDLLSASTFPNKIQQNNYPSIIQNLQSQAPKTSNITDNKSSTNSSEFTAKEIAYALRLLGESKNPHELLEKLEAHIQNKSSNALSLKDCIDINDEDKPILTELGQKILNDYRNNEFKALGVMATSTALSATFPILSPIIIPITGQYLISKLEKEEKEEKENRFLGFTEAGNLLGEGNKIKKYGAAG